MKILLILLPIGLIARCAWTACYNEDHYGIFYVLCDNISSLGEIPSHLYASRKHRVFLRNSSISLSKTKNFRGMYQLDITDCNIRSIEPDFFDSVPTLDVLKIVNSSIYNVQPFPKISLAALRFHGNIFDRVPEDWLFNLYNLKLFVTEDNIWPNLESIPKDYFKNLPLILIFLDNARLSELKPESFRTLNDLTELSLVQNSLKTLPDKIFEDLKKLGHLKLDFNKLSGFNDVTFKSLQILRTLSISRNDLRSISVEWFEPLISLKHLDLSQNLITKFSMSFKNLTFLNMSRNKLEHIKSAAFEKIATLEELDLSYNLLTNLPDDALKGLDKLKILNLARNKIDHLQSSLFKYSFGLEILVLNDNYLTSVTGVGFDYLSNLKYLKLSGNNLKSLQTSSFFKLSALEQLDLENTSLSTLEPSFFEGLNNLKSLTISDNKFEQLTPGVFQQLANLQSLNIANIGLSKLELATFSNLTKLSYLNLEGNRVDELPNGIFDGFSLEFLSVKGNPIRIISRDIYQGQAKLKELNFENTPIESLEETDVIPDLRYAFLMGTKFENRIVFRIKTRRFEKINERAWDTWCPEYLLTCHDDV